MKLTPLSEFMWLKGTQFQFDRNKYNTLKGFICKKICVNVWVWENVCLFMRVTIWQEEYVGNPRGRVIRQVWAIS